MIEENDNQDAFKEPYKVIDRSEPNEVHLIIQDQLLNLCKEEFHVLEAKEDKDKKENAMLKMNEILKTWMSQVNKSVENKLDYANSFARLLCFGSYKLGVSTPKGDIDAIVLAPNYVDREKHFFGDLYNLLMEYSKYNKNINDLTCVNFTHSITPLIKLEFYGVQMDLLFANMDNVSQFDGEILASGISDRPNLYNDFLMDHMDDKMKRSFNGFRNAEMILHSLIEDSKDNQKRINKQLETFRLFLRCIKIFHKRKGIFENKFGYLGGISLALLAAKIFQMYPYYSAPQLIERFLYIYGYEWDWDNWKVNIVQERQNPSNKKNPAAKVENNEEGQDLTFGKRKRFMEVMTPAWPQMSSTYNISYSTRNVIIKTYQKFQKIAEQKILKSETQMNSPNMIYNSWKEFFEEETFFINYDQFIEFIIVGNEEEKYLKWKGFIEAKTRNFCEKIELLLNNFNFEMQIWPRTYSLEEIKLRYPYEEYISSYQYSEKLYIGLKLLQEYETEIDLNHYLAEFLQYIDMEWNSENHFRNPDDIDFYIYMIERDDLEIEHLGLDIKMSTFGDLNDTNRNKLDILNQNAESGEVLNDLLD